QTGSRLDIKTRKKLRPSKTPSCDDNGRRTGARPFHSRPFVALYVANLQPPAARIPGMAGMGTTESQLPPVRDIIPPAARGDSMRTLAGKRETSWGLFHKPS